MKGGRRISVETHLIAMKAVGQREIFMFTYNICDHIFMQNVQNSVLPDFKQAAATINTPL